MSKYTTGEIAKLCGVSVRTVQYYDSRNILVPSELSEGGRRLYSEEDLKRMRIICFLRDLGLPINAIVRYLTGIPQLTAYLPWEGAVILVAISMLLTIVAGLIPSRMAAKKDPVVALRTE